MFGMTTTAQQFGSMVGPVFASIVSTILGYPMYLVLQVCYYSIWDSNHGNYLFNMINIVCELEFNKLLTNIYW